MSASVVRFGFFIDWCQVTLGRIAQTQSDPLTLEQIAMLCSRPSFLRRQESSPTPRPLDAGSCPA